MAVNFSNVNISLRQFHDVASGKYNAGDIKLTSETDLDRNYVWYNQETRKGLWPMMIHEYGGGWEFNLLPMTVG